MILAYEEPIDEHNALKTILVANFIIIPSESESTVVLETFKCDLVAIQLIQTASRPEQILPEPGVHEICLKVQFQWRTFNVLRFTP